MIREWSGQSPAPLDEPAPPTADPSRLPTIRAVRVGKKRDDEVLGVALSHNGSAEIEHQLLCRYVVIDRTRQ